MSAAVDDIEASSVSFYADYIHIDTGRGHRVFDDETPVVVDGFDWTTRIGPFYAQPSIGYEAGAVVGDTVRARGIITSVEADADEYLIEVSPDT
ncbi:hypothetical protein PN419_00365 [Halorubrum ezzemoulense]|uniref:hypothetical protein n=1 Tax=Halorubrum ezzemoulense TaxID=337243 RepID=UPI00233141C6|nr:hypothetical protein [Halorubrum ezzemoulense]MDB9247460.1 hypothetical protein [Halorubrum ezzemoulense]MDB9258631.1 hypothetical protein [Halorubrum ezzemoulense]MDB9264511.1 hypothetical protein [Halorubrum ezzemoulense]MDB9268992.1 hypothetical protein [Halorubrum ezzemoulense]MDB9271479.1 hypothetical protein [Halorubrum ezzemoulense]